MKKLIVLWLAAAVVASGQQVTPNIGLLIQTPPQYANNWGAITNYNFQKIDTAFAGVGSQFKGTWVNSTSYAAGNVVQYVGQLYMSIQSSNLNQNPVSQTAYWTQISGALAYPSAGLVVSTGSAWRAPTYNDVVSLWTSCTSGYLQFNGTCSTPSGTGIAQINSQSGPNVTFQSTGATVGITTPSSNVINLEATGGSGGVPFNPVTTNNVVVSFSGLYDDNHQSSPAVAVSTWSCGTGTCTVNTTGAHNLTAGKSYVDMTQATGFGATQQAPFNGSFLVASTPTSSSFTFAYTGSAVSGTGGNIYDASFWAIYETAIQPAFLGHGTLYGAEGSVANADTNFSTLIAPLCTAPGPCNLIINAGQNDLNNGDSAATIEGHLQSIWAKAHTAGFKVWQGTISGANYGSSPNLNILQDTAAINAWLFSQTINFAAAATGQYFDHPIDYANSLSSYTLNGYLGSGATPAQNVLFAQLTNTAFITLSGQFTNPPIYNYGPSGLVINQGLTGDWYWMNNAKQFYMQLGSTDTNGAAGLQLEAYTGNNEPMLDLKTNQTNMSAYAIGPVENQLFVWGYNYVGDRNATNALWLCVYDSNLGCHNQPSGSGVHSVDFYLDSTVGFPGVSPGIAVPAIGLDSTGKIVPASGGGTTTNPLTGAATGGAAPGATFNGSAAVTFDYHTLGADVAGAAAAVTLSSLGGVPTTTTVNGHALSSNVVISASDLTTGTLPHAQLPTLLSGDIPNNAANTTGTSANVTTTSNSTLTTLSALALPYSQITGSPATFTAQSGAGTSPSIGCYSGFTCTAESGVIDLVVGTSPPPFANLVMISWTSAFTHVAVCTFAVYDNTVSTILANVTTNVPAATTTSGWAYVTSALTAAHTLTITYYCM